MLLSARVEAGPDSAGYEYVAQMVRSLLPMMERFGIVSAEVVGIDTLAARLRDEVMTTEGIIQLPALIGAWARTPTGCQSLKGMAPRITCSGCERTERRLDTHCKTLYLTDCDG